MSIDSLIYIYIYIHIYKQQFIYDDALKYGLQILGLTKTHVVQEDILTISARHETKQWRHKVYYGGIQSRNQYTGTVFL